MSDHGGAAQEPLGQVDESAFCLDAGAQFGGRIEGSLDSFVPVHGQGVPGDVERHHQQRACAGGLHRPERAVDQRFQPVGEGPVAEVEHRGLGQAATELVGARDDQVRTLRQGIGGNVGVEPEVGGPRLVDDQQHIAGVGDLGKRPHVGDGAEVAGGHHIGRDRLGVGVQGGGEGFGTQPVGSADLGVHVGLNVVADETAEDHSVHHAGVHAALHDDMLAEVAKRQAGDEVSFRCAVGHQPGAAGPPRLGSEPRGLLQCRGRGALVDPVHQRWQIEFQHPFAEQL